MVLGWHIFFCLMVGVGLTFNKIWGTVFGLGGVLVTGVLLAVESGNWGKMCGQMAVFLGGMVVWKFVRRRAAKMPVV